MSRRTKVDYVAIFRRLVDGLEDPLVEWFMLDYEAAAWQGIREVFPTATIRGCVFHWSQRITALGLARAYMDRKDTYIYLRKLMSLPFLPSEDIRPSLIQLRPLGDTSRPLQELTEYIARTWIYGSVLKPENWSVFRETVRTNNDCEGWHRRINGRAGKADLSLYVLIPLLLGEAETVDMQMRLVSENLLQRVRRTQYARIHGRLFGVWDRYDDGDVTTSQLLREVSKIPGLVPAPSSRSHYTDD